MIQIVPTHIKHDDDGRNEDLKHLHQSRALEQRLEGPMVPMQMGMSRLLSHSRGSFLSAETSHRNNQRGWWFPRIIPACRNQPLEWLERLVVPAAHS